MSITQTYRGKVDLSTSGSILELSFIGSTDPGNTIQLINYTVPANRKLITLELFITCRLETRTIIKVDLLQIGSGRTGPGQLNYLYEFKPYREIIEGENLVIELQAMSGRPATDIEAYLQARLITT